MFDSFHKALPKNTFYVMLVKILHLEKKKTVMSAPACLSLLFEEKMWFVERELGGQKREL